MPVQLFPATSNLYEIINSVPSPGVGAVVTCRTGDKQVVVTTGHRREAWSLLKQVLDHRIRASTKNEQHVVGSLPSLTSKPLVALVGGPVPHQYFMEAHGYPVTFSGVVRNDRLSTGQVVSGLMYESYAPMALRWMKGIASEQQLGVFVHTGAGSVPVGSVSVLVAGPSIGSVETAVEALKSFVPIWKQDLVTIEKETIDS